jgi:GR25 family glycosyltransferase involved in LPS biosynthesis
MKTLNDYFDNIYCINLDRRPDRWKECQEIFEKQKCNVQRFPGVDAKNIPEIMEKVNRTPGLVYGDIGCGRSHRLIIESARDSDLDKILILEDDVQFHEDLNHLFFQMITKVPDDWDILFLGCNTSLNNPWQKEPVERINDNVYKLTFGYSTHSYAVRKKSYNKIIECLLPENDKGDVLFSHAQTQLNTYVLRPHLAWQRESYSDVLEEKVYYDFLQK